MFSDFLYGELQNIMGVLKDEELLPQDVLDECFLGIARLRMAIAKLDSRDPLPLIDDLVTMYQTEFTDHKNQLKVRGDNI